jgi:hypothetical protein
LTGISEVALSGLNPHKGQAPLFLVFGKQGEEIEAFPVNLEISTVI